MENTLWPSLEFNNAAPMPLKQVPTEKECYLLWEKYTMLPHISEHCMRVADFAVALALHAKEQGYLLDIMEVRAAALLHDIAKSYTIKHGGSHAQLGASWVMQETHNSAIAQAVLHHVIWPWQNGPLAALVQPVRLPLLISYADKRVRHTSFTSLKSRFEDLLARYGTDEHHRASISYNFQQSKALEEAFCQTLGFSAVEELDEVCGI